MSYQQESAGCALRTHATNAPRNRSLSSECAGCRENQLVCSYHGDFASLY